MVPEALKFTDQVAHFARGLRLPPFGSTPRSPAPWTGSRSTRTMRCSSRPRASAIGSDGSGLARTTATGTGNHIGTALAIRATSVAGTRRCGSAASGWTRTSGTWAMPIPWRPMPT